MVVHHLDKREARRIAIHAQLLDEPRPTDLVEVVDRLTVLQIDPTAAIAPSADLVLWSRLGSAYDPSDLTKAIEVDRTLVETVAYIRSPRDLPAVIAEVREAEMHPVTAAWLEKNESFRRDIVELLAEKGPLLSRDIPDTSVEPWPSSGWTNNRNVTKMLEMLALRGYVAISGRKGRQRYWDLPERVYPVDLPTLDLESAVRIRNERRLAALGIARSSGTQLPGEPPFVGDAGAEAVVEGTPGTWRVHPDYLGLPFVGRTALLSPFDRLIHDRIRAEQLFGFEYILEMYKPKDARRWGYFALPVLHDDQLVGKLDATVDRKARTLVVNAIHEDVPFTPEVAAGVRHEIEDLATWLHVDVAGHQVSAAMMHEDQVDVTVDVVRRLLDEQFPQWRRLPVREVASEGTVNAIYRIGDRLAARFPLRWQAPEETRSILEREASASRELALCSPVPTPLPVAIGAPGDGYPLPWAVQTWLPGRVATLEDPSGSVTFAQDLAAFIASLRAADTRGRRFSGPGRGGHLPDHDDWMALCLQKSQGLLDVDRLRQVWADLRGLPRPAPDVMSHGDLVPGNVLVRDGRLVGVLDGGGFGPADPALDLVAAWHLLDHAPRQVLRRALGCDDVEWRRGMAWAFQQAMGLVWYYAESNPSMSRLGTRTLQRLLAET